MAFKNSYTPPAPIFGNDTDPPEAYDLNCVIPIPAKLESDRVLLVSFIPSLHAKEYYDSFVPDLDRYMPFSTPTYQSFLDFLEGLRRRSDIIIFAIVDKTKAADPAGSIPGRVAGMIGYINIAPNNMALEIGPVVILPPFQRTFVASNAIGLMLKYALDLPNDDGTGGLGYRRVVWSADPENGPSLAAAERMGFKKEGVMRYTWVLPEGRPGKAVDERRGARRARDSVILAVCWDDWENGGRELVERCINRV